MTEQSAERNSSASSDWRQDFAIWTALLLALSPTLYDLALHWIAHPWARYSLGFAPLIALAIRSEVSNAAGDRPHRVVGLALIAVALLGQILALLSATIFIARPFAALALIGGLLNRSQVSLRSALLVAWLIPVPYAAIAALGGGALATAQAGAVQGLFARLGIELTIDRRVLAIGDAEVVLEPVYGGMLVIVQCIGLAWYYASRRRLDWRRTGIALLVAIALGLPIQFAAIALAMGVAAFDQAGLAAWVIDPGSWIAPLVAVAVIATPGVPTASSHPRRADH